MKIIISSLALSNELNKIDFDINHIECLQYENSNLCLYADDKTFVIRCGASFDRSKVYNQIDIRWDWIKKLMNQIDEQPVVLNISESNISVLINY